MPIAMREETHFRHKKNPNSADEFRRLDDDRKSAWVLTIREVTLLNVSIELGEGQDVMSCPRRKELEWNPLTAIEGS
jgi:hypothetical protein